MIDNYTEAEHLAEICDYDFEEESYEDWEKELYLDAKAHCFSKSDIGKFVVIQNSRRKKNIMPTMFLVDRHKTKSMWWSPSSFLAMVFEKESAAKYQAKRYKYNNARVKKKKLLLLCVTLSILKIIMIDKYKREKAARQI